MRKLKDFLLMIITCSLIISCSANLEDYDNISPNSKANFSGKPFDIKEYFNGDVIAWGMVQDYSYQVTRRFCVEIVGTWQGDNGVLAETFYFDDGEVSYRNWQLSKKPDGSYQGTAEDVVGIAIGKHQGFAFQFEYVLSLVVSDKTYEVTMDDWMYQLDQYRVFNKTSMSKFGINVADITLFFDKETQNQTCQSAAL